MDNKKALYVLKLFYYGCEDMERLSKRAGISRDEAREILKCARECGLINYSTQSYNETFCRIKKEKLETYLRSKGVLDKSLSSNKHKG